MIRQIVLDTETTGLEVEQGHRVIELAAVEIVNRRLTGNRFHRYVNPQRAVETGALEVHGLTNEFLLDKPRFTDIADEFLGFIDRAELIIHNAAFDVAFLDTELALAKKGSLSSYCSAVTDTLRMARDLHPGKRNSLDALCERYQIDNSARTLHGALLDAELLADVYLAMTRGQETLTMDLASAARDSREARIDLAALELIVLAATDEELAAHRQQLEAIDKQSRGACLWKRLESEAASASG
jgi:DNA polymerase-3 subunit epsilon